MATTSTKRAPLRVDLPGPDADRPVLSRVGIVAAIGFAIGIAWPRFMGLQLGPDVPGSKAAAAAAAAAANPEPGASGTPAAASVDEPDAEDDAEGVSNKQQVVIADGRVASCRTKKNDKIEECGKLAFDRLAKTRLTELARCPAAIGLDGTVDVGIQIQFDKSEVVVVEGEKSALPTSTVRGVLACAGKALEGLELDKVPHTHDRYVLRYQVSFFPPGKAPVVVDPAKKAEAAGEEPALGRATITWEKALLRETPKDGKVVARIPQGGRVDLLEQDGDWYKVKSGDKTGWLYRQAIGK